MLHALENHIDRVCIGRKTVTGLRFADNIDSLAESKNKLANLVRCLDETASRYGMKINVKKINLMRNSEKSIRTPNKVSSQQPERIKQFKYVGVNHQPR